MKERMNKIKNIMNSNHDGFGGLYFIFTNMACAFIMFIALQLSWDSQAVAMADNLAYIANINVAVNSYTTKTEPFDSLVNPSIKKSKGGEYKPLNDFNNMLISTGLTKNGGSSTCTVSWTGTKAYSQFGEFETSLGTKVRPHRQESIIEEN